MKIRREQDHKLMEWKNKQGTTLEFLIEPPNATVSDAFTYRLSSATMHTSCPFSSFPGYSRILVQLDGPPMTIIHNETEKVKLEPLHKHLFSGDIPTRCEVSATVREFNVMTKDDSATATLDKILLNGKLHLELSKCSNFFYCVDGNLTVSGESLTIGEVVIMENENIVVFEGRGVLFHVRLHMKQ
jgi:hypothetical protein